MTFDDYARDYIDASDCDCDDKCARCWRAWKYDDFPAEDVQEEPIPLVRIGPGGTFTIDLYGRDFS